MPEDKKKTYLTTALEKNFKIWHMKLLECSQSVLHQKYIRLYILHTTDI